MYGVWFHEERGLCGTGMKYIENVYFHHEAESKATYELLSQNRKFQQRDKKFTDKEILVGIDRLLEDL